VVTFSTVKFGSNPSLLCSGSLFRPSMPPSHRVGPACQVNYEQIP
jgi:hypothetical protein